MCCRVFTSARLRCTLRVYRVQRVSGTFWWKLKETGLFDSFERKIPCSNGTSEKSPVFQDGILQTEIHFLFLESHLRYHLCVLDNPPIAVVFR